MFDFLTYKEISKLSDEELVKYIRHGVKIHNQRLSRLRKKDPVKASSIFNQSARTKGYTRNELLEKAKSVNLALKNVPTKKEETRKNIAEVKALLAKINYENNGTNNFGDKVLTGTQANRIKRIIDKIERGSRDKIFYNLLSKYSDSISKVNDFDELENMLNNIANGIDLPVDLPTGSDSDTVNRILNKLEI